MRRAGLTVWMWLTLASVALGQSVKLPAEVKTEPGLFAVVRAETDCGSLQWVAMDTGLALLPPELLKDSRVAVVQAVKAGRYRLLAYGAKGDVASSPAICTVIVGDAPEPVPPVPPVPPDPPVPPTPTTGDRVFIVYESSQLSSLPPGQLNILYAKGVRDYLDAHTATASDGRHAWRIWDKDVDASGEASVWQDLLKRKRDAVPWVIISGEKGVSFEGPLPASVDDALSLFKKYLGGK